MDMLLTYSSSWCSRKIVFFHPDWQSTFKVQGTSRYVIHTLPQQSNVVTRMRQIFSLIVVQGVQEKKTLSENFIFFCSD